MIATLALAFAITEPLRVDGTRFNVPLKGAIICCEKAKENGWPLVSGKALRQMARAGVNWTHIRLGPSPPHTEGPEFAAYRPDGSWNPDFWKRVRQTLAVATSLGIYVEVDVVDAWMLEHGRNAWGEDCAITRRPPARHHKQWIRKVVAETGDFPNVTYHIGNETSDCGATREWEVGVRDVLRGALGGRRRLIGTNSLDESIQREFDYVTRHTNRAQPPTDRPLVINETGPLAPAEFREQFETAQRLGTYFVLWRGRMKDGQWERALGYLAEPDAMRRRDSSD